MFGVPVLAERVRRAGRAPWCCPPPRWAGWCRC